ncbi:hypothetical protein K457DRAFT_509351 [Linnemannia elongata AG-77]|uniref:Uncharacterized protein n=1 Tax=Linnemannia elongata AG-77 TaxID=1314771 RepID=A0A197JVV6_9FUNG|nr:hypothetical protein K457DRAFT_509351 [Linnemannia elongata AG-77]
MIASSSISVILAVIISLSNGERREVAGRESNSCRELFQSKGSGVTTLYSILLPPVVVLLPLWSRSLLLGCGVQVQGAYCGVLQSP